MNLNPTAMLIIIESVGKKRLCQPTALCCLPRTGAVAYPSTVVEFNFRPPGHSCSWIFLVENPGNGIATLR